MIARCVTTGEAKRQDFETCTLIAHALRADGFDASEDGTGRGTPLVPVAFSCKDYGADAGHIAPTLRAMTHAQTHANAGGQVAVAISLRGREGGATAEMGDDLQNCLRASNGGGDKAHVLTSMRVRRLTPRECERLQGFPDDYTLLTTWKGWRPMDASETPESCRSLGLEVRQSRKTGKWRVRDVDGPRYKALGNSWAVPVVRWIGQRIELVDAVMKKQVAA